MEETNAKKWYVYIHTNKINNKVYVGITSLNPEDRWGHNGNNYRKDTQPVFARAIDKYGWDNFKHEIIAENLIKEDAIQMEIELIKSYKSNCRKYNDPTYGYNMTDGGEGLNGVSLSDDRKQQLRDRQIKKFENPEERKKLSKWAKEWFATPENNPMFGKHHSEESKVLISKKVKEGMSDENLRKKLSDLKKDVYDGEKNPRYGSGKAVIQLTLDDKFVAEYVSAFDAYRKTEIRHSTIYDCCNHKQGHYTAGGFKWIYKDEYDKLTQQNDLIEEEDEI